MFVAKLQMPGIQCAVKYRSKPLGIRLMFLFAEQIDAFLNRLDPLDFGEILHDGQHWPHKAAA
ncbi:hypothetical protein D3C74_359620 [compost metagenome]